MKKVCKGDEPKGLMAYKKTNPNGTWDEFKSSNLNEKGELQQTLMDDQGGLCVYCEIKLLRIKDDRKTSDFRVEHFHPKSKTSTNHNYHLDWQNLFACCHGGSSKYVVDASERFSSESDEHSCDVPKANHDWDDVILNPLKLHADARIFTFSRSNGKISVNDANNEKAMQTILKLNLNSPRLKRHRKTILYKVNDELRRLTTNGYSLQQAREILTRQWLTKDAEGHW